MSASNYDEFNIMKYLIALNIVNGNIKAISVPAISTDANVKSVITQIKATSNKMKFMTADYNIAGVKTHSKHEEQTVIVTADFDAAIDVNVLAAAFNMEKQSFCLNACLSIHSEILTSTDLHSVHRKLAKILHMM